MSWNPFTWGGDSGGSAVSTQSGGTGAAQNTGFGGMGGLINTLEGNPAGVSQQIQQLMQMAFQQGNNINRTLQNEKAQSEQYYQPMQKLFGSMYGTKGLMPPKAPVAPGGGSAS